MKNSAPGVDEIPAQLLKIALTNDLLFNFLHQLLIECWNQSSIPEEWRIGITVALFKKGLKDIFDNYRGITLQIITYKILDRIITTRLKIIMKVLGLIQDNQGGYTEGRWSMDWIYILQELIDHHIASNTQLFICLFDALKAFDKVWLHKLFIAIHSFGIQGQIWLLLVNIYKTTKSRIRINGILSSLFSILLGVKQGGISSPALYLLFIDPLLQKFNKMNIGININKLKKLAALLFCDDTLGLTTSAKEMQFIIDTASQHCKEWLFQYNEQKCVVMVVNAKTTNYNFCLNGQSLKVVKEAKYLGKIFQTNGKNTSHWSEIISKVEKRQLQLLRTGIASKHWTLP